MAEKALAIDYEKIDLATQTRLLTLQNGAGHDKVICTLSPVNREGAKYHALSYEWGEPSKDDPDIMVNNRKVQIRRNLFDALRSSDLKEKSEEVAMMGNTFAGAIRVIAWLGLANDDSDLAMDLMSDDKSLDASLPSLSKDSHEGKALSALCYRTYWRRVWIIQELHLARSFVVWCGAKFIPRDTIEDSVGALNRVESPFNSDKIFEKNPAKQLNLARNLRRYSPRTMTLRWWLAICVSGDFQCSKKQDFVYALLDISADSEAAKKTFKVDYSKSSREGADIFKISKARISNRQS
ncbi:Heterokaryon incompatibility 6 OR allele [Fusarium acutatum]|uniref:Heterokaryon incompatibility 6 OR allele n=1 Tax=Fusarium acutatum TaxID=78861 RepID=A0A8H4JID0_9HYPO|nr:Heterokaryon incompatibility 6 OR allele [Fusarium acutatum]